MSLFDEVRQDIKTNNESFKEFLDEISYEGRPKSIEKHDFLEPQDIADWRLCSAYIDWFLAVDGEESVYNVSFMRNVIDSSLESFIENFEKRPNSVSVKKFDQLLAILSLGRWKAMKVNTSRLDISDLQKEIFAR